MRCTLSAIERRVFCFFCICTSVASSGVSMPVKSAKKFAPRIMTSSSGSSARFIEASVDSLKG